MYDPSRKPHMRTFLPRYHLKNAVRALSLTALQQKGEIIMRAAFYECDITPPLGGFMWGHYARKHAKTVYDRLYAKAVVVEDAGELVAILVVDTCALPEDMHDIVTQRIFEYTGITPDRVCITSNHSHAGAPVSDDNTVGCRADEPYKDVFYRLCADAVTLAYNRLENVEAKFGTTEVHGISFNRDTVMEDGTMITSGRGRKGTVRSLDTIDPELPVLMFEQDGKPVGAIINFACHQCCMGDLYGDIPGYSGDFSSELSKQLKAHYGNDFVSLFVLGTCGDISHINHVNFVPHPPLWYREMGKRLAEGVIRAANQAEPVPGGVGVFKEVIQIERRQATPESTKEMLRRLMDVDTRFLRTRNLLYYEVNNTQTHSCLAIQAIRIGDVCISALPGEIFVAYGLAIKAASPFKRNMVVENCNSYCGYIPTKQAFSEKSELYETYLCFHSCLIPEAGEIIQNKALELMNKLT